MIEVLRFNISHFLSATPPTPLSFPQPLFLSGKENVCFYRRYLNMKENVFLLLLLGACER